MALITQLLIVARSPQLRSTVLLVLIILLTADFLCWIAGGLTLYAAGRNGHYHPYALAWLPFGQIWYEIRLAHRRRTAKRTAKLLWWFLAANTVMITGTIWIAVCYLSNAGSVIVYFLLIVTVLAALAALYCYVRVRMLEYKALRALIPEKPLRRMALFFTVLGIPIQRVILFLKKFYIK